MLSLIIHTIVSLFAVMNQIGNVPIFLSLTEGNTEEERRKTDRKSLLATFIILLIFILVGHTIFHLFDITIDAFRVAGGILIFGIAYNLLHAKQSKAHSLQPDEHQEGVEKDDVSITPLAIPIFAGPGTIATVMALAAFGDSRLESGLAVIIGILIVIIGMYLILYFSGEIDHYLGKTGMNVITRMMGLLLAVIAVQMIVKGLSAIFPAWL